jgi:hypothetical protein
MFQHVNVSFPCDSLLHLFQHPSLLQVCSACYFLLISLIIGDLRLEDGKNKDYRSVENPGNFYEVPKKKIDFLEKTLQILKPNKNFSYYDPLGSNALCVGVCQCFEVT